MEVPSISQESAEAPKLQSAVQLINFSLGYQARGSNVVTPAVEGVNLEIPLNTVTTFIGHSGSGKSTVLKAINRMLEIDKRSTPVMQGTINYNHGDTWIDIYGSQIDPVLLRRQVGMVFQKSTVLNGSIYDNVAYGLAVQGVPKKERMDIVKAALQVSYLWEEINGNVKRSPHTLSGGQLQRMCIARTIAAGPQLILMDEPCSALDPIATQAIEHLIADLVIKYEKTIVVVTHNMEQAKRLSKYDGYTAHTAFFHPELITPNKDKTVGRLHEFATTTHVFSEHAKPATRNYVNGLL